MARRKSISAGEALGTLYLLGFGLAAMALIAVVQAVIRAAQDPMFWFGAGGLALRAAK